MIKNIPLVITCSAKPSIKVYLSNTEERLRQYKKSIDDWVKSKVFERIVIVDNSGTSILSKQEIEQYKYNKIDIEQIIFGPESFVKTKGSSWGTARIYENAIIKSKHVHNSTHFAVTTGRTFVKNANILMRDFDKKNIDKTYVNKWLGRGYKRFQPGRADLRFVIWNKNFFIQYMSPLTSTLDDGNGIWIEHVYNNVFEKHKEKIKSFSSLPRVIGQAGHQGGYYDGTYFYKWKIKDLIGKLTNFNKY